MLYTLKNNPLFAAIVMLTTYHNLHHFFHNSINTVLSSQQVHITDHTKIYLANLLTSFSRSENLFENTEHGLGLRPLTEYYKDAIYTRSKSQQFKHLQRLGDVALFIAGAFSDSLAKKSIDIDFYIAMGENAYSYLSDFNSEKPQLKAQQEAFFELSHHFLIFVDIIAEINNQANTISHADLLRQYDIWLKTRSKRAEKLLHKFGVELNTQAGALYKH